MSKEKQIESTDWLTRGMSKEEVEREKQQAIMSADLEECHAEYSYDGVYYTDYDVTAEKMVAKGYRKQSEGEWIKHEDDWCGNYYTCSACGCDWTTIDGTPWENNMRYCPECGAKMRKEDGNEQRGF